MLKSARLSSAAGRKGLDTTWFRWSKNQKKTSKIIRAFFLPEKHIKGYQQKYTTRNKIENKRNKTKSKQKHNNYEYIYIYMVVMQKVLVSVLYKMTFQVRNQSSAKVFFRVC